MKKTSSKVFVETVMSLRLPSREGWWSLFVTANLTIYLVLMHEIWRLW